ncbi:MAG: hypothetical protein K2M20_08470 [Lachnospiraceae bacterium]|nr:hypothetical protein [Lachnospiraceae bacterium]
MKKIIALALVGTMIFSVPVMAEEVGAPVAVYLEESSDIGEPAETVLAIEENKTIGEHMNNAVINIWDMLGAEVQDLAIGQGAVLDGVEAPGLTFDLVKPDLKRVYAAKELAQGKGSLLTVVNVHTHAGYGTAKINFYAPGVKAGQAITVYQRITDEEWVAVPTEVSDDHVVVEITDNNHLAFIEAK